MKLLYLIQQWNFFIDIFIFVLCSLLLSSFFYYYKRRDLPGKFIGSIFFSSLGSIIFLGLFQVYTHDILNWLMSPKIKNIQISNLDLISVFLGGYLSLSIVNKLNHNREKRN